MNNATFIKRRLQQTLDRFALCDAKAVDYTQGDDRLDNFTRNGKELDLHPYRVLGVYLKKHIDAIMRFIRTDGKGVYSENIKGRIYDLQNYGDLLLNLIEEVEGNESQDLESN